MLPRRRAETLRPTTPVDTIEIGRAVIVHPRETVDQEGSNLIDPVLPKDIGSSEGARRQTGPFLVCRYELADHKEYDLEIIECDVFATIMWLNMTSPPFLIDV